MHPRSKLSQPQREKIVESFEHGYSSRSAEQRTECTRDAVRELEDRSYFHTSLLAVSCEQASQK